jgi:methyl-accepting chemotaxis protein
VDWFKNQKIWVRLVATIWAMLVLLLSAMIIWAYVEQKANAEIQAQDFASSVHQMTMASLTAMMMTGSIGERALYLEQVRNAGSIQALEVFRGDQVSKQFGPGASDELATEADEQQVLASGKPVFQLNADKGYLKAIIPAVAQKDYLGKNCLTCHLVPEGTVLGARQHEDLAGKGKQSDSAVRFDVCRSCAAAERPVPARRLSVHPALGHTTAGKRCSGCRVGGRRTAR